MNTILNYFIPNNLLAKKKSKDNNGKEKLPEKDYVSTSLKEKWDEHINLIEEKTGFSGYFVILFLISCMFMVFFGFLEKIIINMIGTLYPAYWSIKSIETDNSDCDEEKHWLTYWVVFSLFTVFDLLTFGIILKFIPFYFFFKIIFFIWLFMPNFKGATILYNLIIVRLYSRYEKHIEDAKENFSKGISKIINDEATNFTKVKESKEAEDTLKTDAKKKLE